MILEERMNQIALYKAVSNCVVNELLSNFTPEEAYVILSLAQATALINNVDIVEDMVVVEG